MLDCQNFGNTYMRCIDLYGKANATPTSATFELTPLCNFNCPMCYVHKKRTPEVEAQMLSTGQWLDLARQARDMGVLRLTLTGGEIFTRPDFWEIYSEINKMGFLISLLSNGSLIDESVIEKFHEYGAPHSMKLSLYGACNETYEKMCGVKDGFDRFSHAVDLLKEANIPFNVTSTIVKENFDDLQKMHEFAKKKFLIFQHSFAIVKSTRNADSDPEKSRLFFLDFSLNLTKEKVLGYKHPALKNPFDRCAPFRRSFWTSWNGFVQHCSYASEPSFPLDDFSLSEAWELLMNSLEKIVFPKECKDCVCKEFCLLCPGTLFAESGNYNKVSKKHCEQAMLLYNAYKENST